MKLREQLGPFRGTAGPEGQGHERSERRVGERVTFPPDGVHLTLASERHRMATIFERKY